MIKKVIIFIGLIIIVGTTVWVLSDVHNNKQVKAVAASPEVENNGNASRVLWALENGVQPDYEDVFKECDFIDARYDKADFSLQTILRLDYRYDESLPEEVQEAIKESVLGFKYWMDQPGEDGMCFWSENHQILFASSEYLAGQLYQEELFSNDNKTGIEHMAMGRERVLTWLEHRWLYGFSEWYSNVYYKEDLMALSNLIEFSEDEEVVVKSQMIMDLLLHDMVTQSYRGTFVTTSGRAYEANKKSGLGNRMNRVAESLFGFELGSQDKESGMDLNFIYMDNYVVPKVLESIAFDTDQVIIKASNGLDVQELETEGLIGLQDYQIMMQWGMEAFTNPEVIENSLAYIEGHGMFSNEFLYDFNLMNIDVAKGLGVLPLVSDWLKLKSNGVAIQRANTYTYKTADFMLATAQSYHPGEFGDQQHIWTATLSNEVSIFTTHPAKPLSDENALSGSPNYWVGSGRLPHSVQDKHINMTIYNIPKKEGFMEDGLVDYTHAYFPADLMDEVIIGGRTIFASLDGTYIAMIGMNDLTYMDGSSEDLIQKGKSTYWVTELSSSQEETFEGFRYRITNNAIDYDESTMRLSYTSGEKTLSLTYQDVFRVNGVAVDTQYNRFDSPYSNTPRKGQSMTISSDGKELYLDFYKLERVVVD